MEEKNMKQTLEKKTAKKSGKKKAGNTNEYYIHFIGKGMYSVSKFEKESLKYGVNRPIPKFTARKMKWGEPILLAHYQPKDKKQYKKPTAEIFGYYTIDGVNITASDEFKEKLYKKLKIVSTINVSAPPVERECGSYVITATHTIADSLEETITKIYETEKETEEKAKLFIAGIYHALEPYQYVAPVKFTQGSFLVKVKTNILKEKVSTKLNIIENYNQRFYIPKKKKAKKNKKAKAKKTGKKAKGEA
jgi:hypothetical protein